MEHIETCSTCKYYNEWSNLSCGFCETIINRNGIEYHANCVVIIQYMEVQPDFSCGFWKKGERNVS